MASFTLSGSAGEWGAFFFCVLLFSFRHTHPNSRGPVDEASCRAASLEVFYPTPDEQLSKKLLPDVHLIPPHFHLGHRLFVTTLFASSGRSRGTAGKMSSKLIYIAPPGLVLASHTSQPLLQKAKQAGR